VEKYVLKKIKLDLIKKDILSTFEKINNSYFSGFWKNYPGSTTYVLQNIKKENIGCLTVISKKINLNNKQIKTACLSNICIFKKFQSKGLSKILFSEIEKELKKKNFDVMLLIARKNLDNFYNKFGFLGNCNFSEVEVKNSNNNKSIYKNDIINNKIKKIYNSNYKFNNGYVFRNKNDWININYKIKKLKLNLKSINMNKKLIGYIVFKKNIILECFFDVDRNFSFFYKCLKMLFDKTFFIKCPSTNLENLISTYDQVLLKKRYILNGGHMIKSLKDKSIYDHKYDIKFLDEF